MSVVNIARRRPQDRRCAPAQAEVVRHELVAAWQRTGGSPAVDAFFGQTLDRLSSLTAPPVEKVFVMAFMEFVEAVSDHLAGPAKLRRPLVAVRVWLRCIGRLDRVTNEILYTRRELAASLGVPDSEVSRVMSELVRIEAVRRVTDRQGQARGAGVVRYFLNERVGNHLPDGVRQDAMAAAPHLKVVVGGLPPTEQRSRAPAFVPELL